MYKIHDLLKLTKDNNASDLHLCVGLPPMIRVCGILKKAADKVLKNDDILGIVKEILPKGKSNLIDSDGNIADFKDIDLGVEIEGLARFRTNIYHDRNGLAVAFRLIPNKMRLLEELGLPEVVRDVCSMKRSLVLVTGITGSGKSTTLASIIDIINSQRAEHVITIEDPIEYVHEHKKCIINQREIGAQTSSFADSLRSALREDPDVILVGEMRDLETISMAITAAETGHLVLSTLHTRGAVQAIDRIIDVFPPHQQAQIRIQLADTLGMVISQVLIPSSDNKVMHLACEIMVGNNAIKSLVREKQTHQIYSAIQTGSNVGMQTLDKSLKDLVTSGKIPEESAKLWALSDTKAVG